MIYPADYRQRILKEQKSRQYKAMLDQQIRQNYLYGQDRTIKKPMRLKTEPLELYDYRSKLHSSSRELPHYSTFLPSINSNNIIDHGFRYAPSGYTPKRYNSLIPSQKDSFHRQNDEELDYHLDRCLEQCDDLIKGINKNLINLNSHLRHGGRKKQKTRNYLDYDMFRENQPRSNRLLDSCPVSHLKGSQFIDSDVGRNQMMNYNLIKSREKGKFHNFSPQKGMSSPVSNRDGFDSLQKTKRKNLADGMSLKSKNFMSKNKSFMDFDTVNSDQQNEFVNAEFQHSKSRTVKNGEKMKMSENNSSKKNKEQEEKIKKEEEAHLEMKKKDSKILEHLRKAKNRGNILFKKIEVFKKQRQQLERSTSSLLEDSEDDQDKKKPNGNASKNIENQIKKEDISVVNNTKRTDGKSSQNKV